MGRWHCSGNCFHFSIPGGPQRVIGTPGCSFFLVFSPSSLYIYIYNLYSDPHTPSPFFKDTAPGAVIAPQTVGFFLFSF